MGEDRGGGRWSLAAVTTGCGRAIRPHIYSGEFPWWACGLGGSITMSSRPTVGGYVILERA